MKYIKWNSYLLGVILFIIEVGFSASLYAQNLDSIIVKDKYKLVWSDEFNQDGVPNPNNWNFEKGFARNKELQWYQSENAICKDGLLVIEARKEKRRNPKYTPGAADWRKSREFIEYTSSSLITSGLQQWSTKGYYEVRARINASEGSWPAIWLLGAGKEWPDNGEIDIMEFYRVNEKPHILANAAWGTKNRYTPAWNSVKIPFSYFRKLDPFWENKFHTWVLVWDSSNMKVFIDGELINTIDLTKTINSDGTNPFTGNQEFYMLLNLAVGSNGGEPDVSAFPIKYEVDYVRVYKQDEKLNVTNSNHN